MNTNFTRILVTCFLLIVLPLSKINAQQMEKALNNPVIMHYYTVEQLQELASTDSNGFNAMIFYFTASYRVDPVDCYDCIPYDSATFDISKYEHLRLTDSVYTREFTKYGFTLTLYPVNSLPYHYNIHEVPRIDPGDNKQSE